jgi:uncharacterized protein YbcV (DUF1398 family)
MNDTEKPKEEKSFIYPSDNQEIITECIRDMVNFGWTLKEVKDESGVTTITFYTGK